MGGATEACSQQPVQCARHRRHPGSSPPGSTKRPDDSSPHFTPTLSVQIFYSWPLTRWGKDHLPLLCSIWIPNPQKPWDDKWFLLFWATKSMGLFFLLPAIDNTIHLVNKYRWYNHLPSLNNWKCIVYHQHTCIHTNKPHTTDLLRSYSWLWPALFKGD